MKSYSESQMMSLPRKLIRIYSLPNNISQICTQSSFYQQILIIKINYRHGGVNFPRNLKLTLNDMKRPKVSISVIPAAIYLQRA